MTVARAVPVPPAARRHVRDRVAATVAEVAVAVALAALALAALGPRPATIGAVALAAVSPRLVRVDLAEHRLPDRMTLPAALAGAVGCALSALTGGPWLPQLISALAFGGLLFALVLAAGVGMGDAKLAVVIGLAAPTPVLALGAPMLGLILGGIGGVIGLIGRGARHRIPYGPFLVAGWALALVAQSALTAQLALG